MSKCEFYSADGVRCPPDNDAEFRVWGGIKDMEGLEHYEKLCDFHSHMPGTRKERLDGVLEFRGGRVAQAREVLSMSRDELADRIGLTEYRLWEWEVHEKQPEDEAIGRMIKAMASSFTPDFYIRGDPPEVPLGSLAIHFPEEDCQVCKKRWSEALCDGVMSDGKPCDLRLCARCRRRPGPDVDYCPRHEWPPAKPLGKERS